MMYRTILHLSVAGVLLAGITAGAVPAALAQERCPAGSSGCSRDNAADRIRERVNEGARNVLNDANPRGRVREVGETLRDCWNCGLDAVQDGMDRAAE